MQGNLLEVYYDRVVGTQDIVLTKSNCDSYGFAWANIEVSGRLTDVYYKKGDIPENYLKDDKGQPTSIYTEDIVERYSHIAPPCSKYEISFADVDKEGSGRNSLTAEMFRERIGSYSMLSIAWDLIPNTKEYNNWYKILTHLPPVVWLKLLTPEGKIEEKKYYRGDVSTNLYLFVSDAQIWQGLSTTFTQWNVDKYDDSVEPDLEV